jgi:hypothetical protein
MKITERRLRLIIRETLLEEQNRIDEGNILNSDILKRVTHGALALGLTLSASQLKDLTKYITSGEIGHSISDPLSGSPKGARGRDMTSADEAELNAFIENPTLDEVPRMIELTNRLDRSFGAGRLGTTPGGKTYKPLLRAVNGAIKKLERDNKTKGAMYSLD